MNRLLTLLGVDYAQWKALTIAGLKLDLRSNTFGGARTKRRRRGASAVVGPLIFYAMTGAIVALLISYMGDRYASAILVVSYAMLVVGTAMLVDHNTIIVSPTDYWILGFQPVTSRTYFASKLTNALVYTLVMTTAVGLPPVGVVAAKYGALPAAALLLALSGSSAIVTLAVVAGYATLLQHVGAHRLRSLLSYAQLLTGFLVYGGYFFVTGVLSRSTLSTFRLARSPWLLLYPPAWFANYVEVAAGQAGAATIVPALMTVALFGFLVSRLRGRLSLEYAERLGALASGGSPVAARARSVRTTPWFRRAEGRAVSILVRSHFRNDIRFRMSVFAILPITAMYLLMGLGDARNGPQGGNFTMVTMAALLFPVLLQANLGHSDGFRAAWVFFVSPADRTRVIRSAIHILIAFFVVPYLAIVGAALTFISHEPLQTAVYLTLVAMVCYATLLIATLTNPTIPFSRPAERARGSSRMVLTMFSVGTLAALLPLLSRTVYGNPGATMLAFAIIIGCTFVLGRMTRRRIERQATKLEFEG